MDVQTQIGRKSCAGSPHVPRALGGAWYEIGNIPAAPAYPVHPKDDYWHTSIRFVRSRSLTESHYNTARNSFLVLQYDPDCEGASHRISFQAEKQRKDT